jgi:hypothetical protein
MQRGIIAASTCCGSGLLGHALLEHVESHVLVVLFILLVVFEHEVVGLVPRLQPHMMPAD